MPPLQSHLGVPTCVCVPQCRGWLQKHNFILIFSLGGGGGEGGKITKGGEWGGV